jgi:hypothetical protein
VIHQYLAGGLSTSTAFCGKKQVVEIERMRTQYATCAEEEQHETQQSRRNPEKSEHNKRYANTKMNPRTQRENLPSYPKRPRTKNHRAPHPQYTAI